MGFFLGGIFRGFFFTVEIHPSVRNTIFEKNTGVVWINILQLFYSIAQMCFKLNLIINQFNLNGPSNLDPFMGLSNIPKTKMRLYMDKYKFFLLGNRKQIHKYKMKDDS